MVVASLVVAVITLVLALFIHSETREMLGRMNAITDTLPAAYDVNRVIKDREKSRQERAKIVSDVPKNTHIAFHGSGPEIPRFRRVKNAFWNFMRKLASCWSGDIYESIVEERKMGKWEIKSGIIESPEIKTLLAQGWEPFSMTDTNMTWLRKYAGK